MLNSSIKEENDIIGDNSTIYTAFSYMSLGMAHTQSFIRKKSAEAYDKGMAAYNRALTIFILIQGENHIYVADTYSNMSNLQKINGEIDKAIGSLRKALEIIESYEIYHEYKHASVCTNLARAYGKKGMKKEGLIYANKALSIFLKLLPENHPTVQDVKTLLNYLDTM